MYKQKLSLSMVVVLSMLFLAACSGTSASLKTQTALLAPQSVAAAAASTPTSNSQVVNPPVDSSLLASYEGVLENIYTSVGPEVVNVSVTLASSSSQSPFLGNQGTTATQQVLGSGFVWDTQGHIVTNNHVVDGAASVDVTFQDGTTVPADVVATDPYSDLAVLKVDVSADQLNPVQVTDSSSLKVGQLAIAIGNPFGLQGTMTVGVISALGRSLPSSETANAQGPVYSIPDIIQTDAPINPGNSGGVLLNDQGQVIGVTAAIESAVNSSAGIGFAIPSDIVQKVIPALIDNGHYDHPYLGISGGSLIPAIAQAMNLDSSQRGALVEDVVSGGPADKAGIQPSTKVVTIEGQNVRVGGDVIIAIDGQSIKDMDQLIAYLNDSTTVGQKVTLTVLRNGQQKDIEVTLEARPNTSNQIGTTTTNSTNSQAYLGIVGLPMSADVASAMNLPKDQGGVLVEAVQPSGPADQAGLQSSETPFDLNGESIMIGGDIITAFDDQPVNSMQDLVSYLSASTAGQTVTLTIIRDGKQQSLRATLGEVLSLLP